MGNPRCFYFGCWGEPGHYLHAPGGRSYGLDRAPEYFQVNGQRIHVDATLAPKRDRRGALCWKAQARTDREHDRIRYEASECPQGEFLIHHLSSGFTAMAWWDRCQGDTRGGCNSVLLLEGEHDATAMRAALEAHFPRVAANLARAGVALVEVPRG